MDWQREFFRLARTYLNCRQHVMLGLPAYGSTERKKTDIGEHVQGMRDYAFEMRLVLASRRAMNAETVATLQAKTC